MWFPSLLDIPILGRTWLRASPSFSGLPSASLRGEKSFPSLTGKQERFPKDQFLLQNGRMAKLPHRVRCRGNGTRIEGVK